jgi:transposase
MKKRTYRKIAVKEVDATGLAAEVGSGRVVFAIDVAKVDMVAAIVAGDGRVVRTVCWKNPRENGLVLELLSGLRRAGLSVEAAMESSGTYGDVLRHQLLEHGVPVYRVSGKRTHDAAEVYDGVPSLHDAKSAAIIAKLHLDGASTPWGFRACVPVTSCTKATIAVPNPSRATPFVYPASPPNPISLLLTALQVLQRLVGQQPPGFAPINRL